MADLVSDLYFCPTELSQRNLVAEGVPVERAPVTGNTVIDALYQVLKRPFDWEASGLGSAQRFERLVLVTAHRRESFGDPLQRVLSAVRRLAEEFLPEGVGVLYPVHPNPSVRGPAYAALSGLPNVMLTEPLTYDALAQVMKRCCLVLTDSGGLQEEAPSLGVPVLVTRETTERPEGVEAGAVKLVGTVEEAISGKRDGCCAIPSPAPPWCSIAIHMGTGRRPGASPTTWWLHGDEFVLAEVYRVI